MIKHSLIYTFITFLLLNCSYAQHKKITLSAHTNISKTIYGKNSLTSSGDTYRDFNLIPRLSYRLNQVWAVGASYHYGYSKRYGTITLSIPTSNDIYNYSAQTEQRNTTNQAGLFVQSYLYDNGKFAAFLEADGLKGSTTVKSTLPEGVVAPDDIKYNILSSGLHAGVRYNFYKGLGAEFRLNKLIGYHQSKIKDNNTKNSDFRVFENIWQDCSLGLSYQF